MKILVVNIKYLGDLIVSTPGIRSLRKKNPTAEIVFMVRKGYEEIFSNNQNIDRVITFDPALKEKSGKRSLFDGFRFANKIRKEKFDVVLALHPSDRIALLSFFSGAKIRIAPRKQSFGFLFNKKVDVLEDTVSYLDYYNKIFSSFDVQIDSDKTEFFISQEAEKWAADFFNAKSITNNDLIVGIHPSASEPTKIWPSDHFVDLINKITRSNNIKVLLLEGPQDKAICREIQKKIEQNSILFYSSNDIHKSAALLKRCRVFITHDTGTRHLAVALEVPTIALVPEDNIKCWDFYDSVANYHKIVGKRILNGNNSYLGNISVECIKNKVNEVLALK